MSYSSLPLTSKLFQLTFLTCALALAGCGGGDGIRRNWVWRFLCHGEPQFAPRNAVAWLG